MAHSTKHKQEAASSTGITSPERRRNLRFPFSASIEVTETNSGAKITGRTSDLGLGGCYVDVISPFPLGAEAQVRIQKGDEHFEALVKVVYSQIGMGMGLAFISAQAKHVRLFQKWLFEISGEEVSAPPESPAKDKEEAVSFGEKDETMNVLIELLVSLVRKGVLSDEEGKALLKRLRL